MPTVEVRVSWDGVTVPGLRTVGPLPSSVGVITYYDGVLGRVDKVPGRPDTGDLTLQREVDDDLSFDVWARGPHLRKEVELALVDPVGGTTIRYLLHQCWVSAYVVEADVTSGLALETVTLTMNAWERATRTVPELADRIAALQQRTVLRIGLGRLVGRSVDETRRRVDEVLDEAERSGAVLLIDEGDALFSRRTEVRDAHDRYAADPLDTVLGRLSRYPFPVLVVPPDPTDPTEPADPPPP